MSALPSDQNAGGRSLGAEELRLLERVIDSGTLFAPKGNAVRQLEEEFAAWAEVDHAIAVSSGTAAVHAAVAALDPEPGDEIITTSITDIGALTPILYQGAIPVFADVDPRSGNVTPRTVADRISDRTRAIVVTHLFGNPIDIEGVRDAAGSIPVIEDCAQAFGAEIEGRLVGSLGEIGAFSLQQGKHITSGEGGLVTTSDPDLAKRARLYVNKAWDYDDPSDHDFLALNYRMSELQGAVGLGQLQKLGDGIETRRRNADLLSSALEPVAGVDPIEQLPGARASFWRFALLVDPELIPGGTDALGARLREIGVPAASRYIKKPAFKTGLFANQRTFGESRWPFTIARPEALDYSSDLFSGTFGFLERVLVLPWNERFGADHVELLARAVVDGAGALVREAA